MTALRRVSPFQAGFWLLAMATLVFLLAPIVIVVLASFNDNQVLSFPVDRFSLRWYRAVWEDFELLESVRVSLIVAAIATVLALALGIPAAFSLARYKFPGRDMISAFLLSPLLIPLIALGLAVLLLYAAAGLRPSLTGFILMHVLITVPYVIRTVLAVLTQLDPALEEAALSLGADDLRTKWLVTMPLIRPGIIAGGFFAFMTSLDNVPVSIFLGSSRMTTLPVRIYGQVESYGIDPVFAAVSTLLIAATLAIMIALDRIIGLDHLK
ncbi:MAG: ABC transporter permease [Alphaproteobacteria bacterium]|nr:ABC transporter permease [Alphaproteobacteria bacterium]